jgi:long-chain fatty acid transport protein
VGFLPSCWKQALTGRGLASLALVGAALAVPDGAEAGGLYLMPRGAEAASRAGARVASSDDPQALWYNPAGLVGSRRQILGDFVLPLLRSDFRRVLDNGQMEPTVSSSSAIPIPTLAYSDNFGLKDWGFGIGLLVPPGAGGDWPDKVNGQPAPQRYSILNANGSAIATLALGAAYTPLPGLSLGATLYVTTATVAGDVAISACDYAFCSQPEAPEWEGLSRCRQGPVVTASGALGATYAFKRARLGASVQLPTKIAGDADFDVTLPDQFVFDDVKLQNAKGGSDLKARIALKMPAIARLGVAFTPLPKLNAEATGTWETWSSQSDITVRPLGVTANNVPGIGTVRADAVTLARHMRDTWSVALGGTYDLSDLRPDQRSLTVNGGLMYESSAFAKRDLSPTTIDTQKLLIGLGASVEVYERLFLDVTYGHIFMRNQNVTNSRVLLPAAIRPLPVDTDPSTYAVGDRPAIGNGRYRTEADYVGLGLRYKLADYKR